MPAKPFRLILPLALASIFCTLSARAGESLFVYQFQTFEWAHFACPSITAEAFGREMATKRAEIPQIEARAPEFQNFLRAHPQIAALWPSKTPVLNFTTGCDWGGYPAPARLTPIADEALQTERLDYAFNIPDTVHFDLEKNALFHEMGHFVMDSLKKAQGEGPEIYEDEAFADFFAYSITGDPNMGRYLERQTGRPRVLRIMKSTLKNGRLVANQDWHFNYVDNYEAGAKFRDALIVISEQHGFDEAFDALKAVIQRQSEIGKARGTHTDKDKRRYAEQACREVMKKYFPSR